MFIRIEKHFRLLRFDSTTAFRAAVAECCAELKSSVKKTQSEIHREDTLYLGEA
jgi:hypothetical protein